MSYKLFLDDEKSPLRASKLLFLSRKNKELLRQENWVIVRNYEDFCTIIDVLGIPEVVSFDYTLVRALQKKWRNQYKWSKKYIKIRIKEEKNGLDCAKYLINILDLLKVNTPNHIILHSLNPIGNYKIKSLFK